MRLHGDGENANLLEGIKITNDISQSYGCFKSIQRKHRIYYASFFAMIILPVTGSYIEPFGRLTINSLTTDIYYCKSIKHFQTL